LVPPSDDVTGNVRSTAFATGGALNARAQLPPVATFASDPVM
jgi:hypothetical protein